MEPPDDVDPRELAPEVRSQLRTLSKVAADRVARHLVAAGQLVDDDPQAALEQARAARALGARVAVVREAVGETAYATGEWAEAIAELRTARRMTGDDSGLPMIADAERALGRPERALRIAQSPEVQGLAPAERAEMRIVEAGARRDLGQLDAALVTLQDFGLDRRTVRPWSARVWYAYADLLLAAGREDEARDWFLAAAGADPDGTTDADERLLELDGIEILADEELLLDRDDDTLEPTAVPDSSMTHTLVMDEAIETPEISGTDELSETSERDRATKTEVAAHGTADPGGADGTQEPGVRGDGPEEWPARRESRESPGEEPAEGESAEGESAEGESAVEALPAVETAGEEDGGESAEGESAVEALPAVETADEEDGAVDDARSEAASGGPAVRNPVPVVFSDQADQSGSSS